MSESPSTIKVHSQGRAHLVKHIAGETLLETGRRAGLPVKSNCEQGNCGACIVKIISGYVRMGDNTVLSDVDIQSGFALACQSIPEGSELEIDIF